MTFAAAQLRQIAEHNSPVKFDVRRRSIVAYDAETRVIVSQFPLGKGVDGHTIVPKLVGVLLDSGQCEIHAVEGEDVDTPLTIKEGV